MSQFAIIDKTEIELMFSSPEGAAKAVISELWQEDCFFSHPELIKNPSFANVAERAEKMWATRCEFIENSALGDIAFDLYACYRNQALTIACSFIEECLVHGDSFPLYDDRIVSVLN